jgi:anti-anti-sigma factor
MATVQQFEREGLTVLKFQGSLTAASLEEVEHVIGPLARRPGARLLVDLAGVDLLATPAISMFVAVARATAQHGGRIVFTQSNPRITDVLHRLRLDALLHTVPDFEQAVSDIQHN